MKNITTPIMSAHSAGSLSTLWTIIIVVAVAIGGYFLYEYFTKSDTTH